jgi:flagellar biosynthesis/type III secretory pathway chaperone
VEPSPPNAPAAALDDEIAKLREFIAILEREQEMLARADIDALMPLIDTKTGMANTLTSLSRKRDECLARLGLPGNRTGMEAWLEKSGTDNQRVGWRELLRLAAHARALNETNGKLINLHAQRNQQAFAALMSAANQVMTYGPDGQQQTGLGDRILGTA